MSGVKGAETRAGQSFNTCECSKTSSILSIEPGKLYLGKAKFGLVFRWETIRESKVPVVGLPPEFDTERNEKTYTAGVEAPCPRTQGA
jgi:hypothetical protein